ncbi:MAG: response regulator transcription factor [Saprospiraceae bacterium]|jgi:DNA-binding response OmpR family regulator|uniref:Response regulator transcription factor n=1 Tax=Candidatus Defluviibacterium haderslevense TaxID=2981993 RepID=A0A9D7XIB3_9BACT|nr:response regulator transcription factor [Candidatus Defluviibacterium haderslevense]MBK9718498.1 response regulator transcription factor [Candidatus Defluviibacterium haderslevense]MBL0235552.1 response regulator transcription factor [Candidatus Defluviibacterium haderslevense]MCC7027676.1 response regulator transcription factor [Saprospiraceae bacterium]MCI1265362.1 response regulator transcription factor [Saprospiraceae bacterium]
MKRARLLYAEDDETLSFITKDHLELQGYEVVHCVNGALAYEAFKNEKFDLCIFDVMLPEMDGFTLAENVRKKDQQIPILFLTAKSLKEDRIHGLKLGGDDYLTKPFSIEELILKIEIFLRRSRVFESPSLEVELKVGIYTYLPLEYQLVNETNVRILTQRESELLDFLLKNKNRVIKRSVILESLWGEDDYFMGRSLDVFISRLRKYLGDDPAIKIDNIHGIGFKFMCP